MTLFQLVNDNIVTLKCKLLADTSHTCTYFETDMSDLPDDTQRALKNAETLTLEEALKIGFTHIVFVWVNY